MHHAKLLSLMIALILPKVMDSCIFNPASSEQAAVPTFQPAEGPFTDSVDVTIDCATAGATIRYTLDGSTPSSTTGEVYNGGLRLTATTTVKAIAFKDGLSESDAVVATYVKSAPTASLTITDPSATGTLVEGAAGTLSVSCSVTASGTQVQAVTADLSAVGGSATQDLTANGDQWTWSGSVTSSSHGQKTISFTATGTGSETASVTATIAVAAPPGAPEITNPMVTGALAVNHSASVTVSCTAILTGGTVDSVTADLTPIGGSATQALTASGDTWAWTGSVTPPAKGTQTITLTATSNSNSAHATATVKVTTSQAGSLAGAWSGNVNYEETTRWLTTVFPTTTAVVASSVTFSAQYQPDSLPVSVGSANIEVLIPTATLMAVNDQVAADVQEPKSGKTYHVVAVVTSITRSSTAFTIHLNLTIANGTTTWTGPYTWTGTLGADDNLTWASTTKWSLGNNIYEDVTSSGTLTRR